MRKKALILAVIMVFTLAGCGEKTVDVTLPAALFSDQTEEDVKKAAEENGYLGCTINENGSVTYTMTESKHREMLDELVSRADESIAELIGKVASFTKINHNSDMSEFSIYMDAEKATMFDKLYAVAFYTVGAYYQSFAGKSADKIDVIIKFIDSETNEVLDTASYRNFMNRAEESAEEAAPEEPAPKEPVFEPEPEPQVEPEPEPEPEPEKPEPTIEAVSQNIYGFRNSLGDPKVSAYRGYINTSDYPIKINNAYIEYDDKDGKLLSVDKYVTCVPEIIMPGEVFYIYSYFYDISDIDISNGVYFKVGGSVEEAGDFYEIEVSDEKLSIAKYGWVKIVGRATNNTGSDKSLQKISAVIYDKDDNVVGFCMGYESLPAGQTIPFEISGELMSSELDTSLADHAEVYIRSAARYW